MTTVAEQDKGRRSLPGDLAWWIFVGAEFFTILAFLYAYLFAFARQRDVFVEASRTLHPLPAFVNTLLLLTSGYLVAQVIHASRSLGRPAALGRLALAIAFGLGFVVVKSWELVSLQLAGYHLSSTDFHFYYGFVGTFHLLHVVLGVGLLGSLLLTATAAGSAENPWQHRAESYGIFWHMLDLVWVLLFALFYLLP